MRGSAPLTLGTAGHVDHGKTTLVGALTGVDTDHLAEEKRRGLTIELGYAPLQLPSGRQLSVIDVPGHERFVRTMVAGVTGIDCFLMVIAATEGAKAQTHEHRMILRVLGVDSGIVVITKGDLADPEPARAQARGLFPAAPVLEWRPGSLELTRRLLEALDALAESVGRRAIDDGPVVLHIDRVFSIPGAGTVATGTLTSGTILTGQRLTLQPSGREVRVRAVQIHGVPVDAVVAGQRVAVNLTRIERRELSRGEVLTCAGGVLPAHVLEVELCADAGPALAGAADQLPAAVFVHHGTRATVARVRAGPLTPGVVQLRCQEPLIARRGDRVVLRDIGRRRTLGGGVVVGLRLPRSGGTPRGAEGAGGALPATARPAAPAPYVTPAPPHGPVAVEMAEAELRAEIEEHGHVTLPGLRDRLGVTRREAKELLDYFDAVGLTLRRADDTRVLRRRVRQTEVAEGRRP